MKKRYYTPTREEAWIIKKGGGLFDRDVDSWAYTEEFETLASRFREWSQTAYATNLFVYRICVRLRKRRYVTLFEKPKLVKVGMTPKRIMNLSEAAMRYLKESYLAQPLPRDKLPYTQNFEAIYSSFQSKYGSKHDRYDVWRFLSNMGKMGLLNRKQLHERKRGFIQ